MRRIAARCFAASSSSHRPPPPPRQQFYKKPGDSHAQYKFKNCDDLEKFLEKHQGNVRKMEFGIKDAKKLKIKISVRAYNVLLKGLESKGDGVAAVQLLNEVEGANIFSYSATIGACAKMAMYRDARKVMDQMTRSSVEPNNFVYTTIIAMAKKSGKLEDVERYEKEMIQRQHLFPD